MKKREKNTKKTPRLVAQTLALSLIMGTAMPTSGLGRVVYAEELEPTLTSNEQNQQVNTEKKSVEASIVEAQAAHAQALEEEASVNTTYNKVLKEIEDRILNPGENDTTESLTQELIVAVIQYDQDAADKNDTNYDIVEPVTLEDGTVIYKASKGEETVYYQYKKNEDGTISLYQCEQKEKEIVTGTKNATYNTWEEAVENNVDGYEISSNKEIIGNYKPVNS